MIGWSEEAANIRAADWLAERAAADRIVYRSSSLVNQLVAARAGIGVSLLPCYLGDPEPGIRHLGAPINDVRGELWIVTHADLRTTARVRAFVDLVGAGLVGQRAAIEGRL